MIPQRLGSDEKQNIKNTDSFRQIRRWIPTSYGRYFKCRRDAQTFILMSYNILAQTLVTGNPHLYANHNKDFLQWSHRLKCIQNEIINVRPAILCLQEVQETHIKDIQQALSPLNYAKPLYKKRTGPKYDDGCAIFYNSNYFSLLDYHYVEYYSPNVKVRIT